MKTDFFRPLIISFTICSLIGCASLPYRKSKIKEISPWMKLYRYPYRDVFDATLAALRSKSGRITIKDDREDHYILAAYGPVMLSYVWYEVYHFEEISPKETLLELGYIISGPLMGTLELKDEKMIKEPMFNKIEVNLIVQEKMREKYKDFSILDLDSQKSRLY